MHQTTNPTTVSTSEVEKFSKLADQWWDPDGEFRTLHQINPVRLFYIKEKIVEHFGEFKPGIAILDIGCGGGLVSVPLAKIGAKVTGLDASSQNINTASLHAKKQGLDIEYIAGTVEEHKGLYDVVLCLEIIEHVQDAEFFIKSAMRLVKPGGVMILSTINRTAKAYAAAILCGEYILRWLPVGTHEFSKFIKPSEISDYLLGSTFRLKELKGLGYSPLTKGWKLQDDIDVNYFAVMEFVD
ncbi:MAG: bifunctional 2-polyprenyl-6-hydroxyphenol methylase/3-demethylubiquinol 3-O-methyltransferase UbiG [Pseudomonadota bacterium]